MKWLFNFIPRPMIKATKAQCGWCISQEASDVDENGDETRYKIVWISPRELSKLPDFEGW